MHGRVRAQWVRTPKRSRKEDGETRAQIRLTHIPFELCAMIVPLLNTGDSNGNGRFPYKMPLFIYGIRHKYGGDLAIDHTTTTPNLDPGAGPIGADSGLPTPSLVRPPPVHQTH